MTERHTQAERASGSTIAALATAPAPAGIAVIRISGPQTHRALSALFRGSADPSSEPRKLIVGEILDHRTRDTIDHGLAVFFPGPHSYTGEDVAELQFHGSPALVQKILRSLFSFGIQPADPGEFTKRAFLNGKIDLVQAEAISELISATSEQALRIASEHLHGRLSATISSIGEPLRNLLAELEASIDFVDDGVDVPDRKKLGEQLSQPQRALNELVQSYSYGHLVREGFRVLLCGRPNAGKSSLLNLLLGHERAIVTPVSGTTRDLIEEQVVLHGHRFVFCDSAGITEGTDAVERIGIELAKSRVPWADLVLLVVDATDSTESWREVLPYLEGKAARLWFVVNKIDLNPKAIGTLSCESSICSQNFYLSAHSRAGLDALSNALVAEVTAQRSDTGQTSQVLTNERHRVCLETAQQSLERTADALVRGLPFEILCSELRTALSALDEIIGKTYTEDLLGRIFSKFCIGK